MEEKGNRQLSDAMAYVATIRLREALRIFTDGAEPLNRMLEHSEKKKIGLSPEQVQSYNKLKSHCK